MDDYRVWVEIEEVDVNGDHVEDWSAMLDGASIGRFDDLDDAIEFGDKIQRLAEEVTL
jgi:hypothetical protein